MSEPTPREDDGPNDPLARMRRAFISMEATRDECNRLSAENGRLREERDQTVRALAQKNLTMPATPDDPARIADRIGRLRCGPDASTTLKDSVEFDVTDESKNN